MTSTELSLQSPIAHLQKRESRSFLRDAMRRLLRDRLTIAAGLVLLVLTLISIIGPEIAMSNGLDPNRTNILEKYAAPGEKGHLLGTDQLGRDQFVRLMIGGRISLSIAYIASLLSISIGVALGLIAGYAGGRIDDVFLWLVTTMTSIPSTFLLLLAAIIWSPSPTVLIIILALLSWIETARLVRGEVMQLRESEFVLAAHSIGAEAWRIMLAHLLPNLLPMVMVNLAINAGTLILAESALSFLGLGIQPPTASWGNMLTDSRMYFARAVHLVIWPGLLITIAVICFYLLGDGLRDALDPRGSRKA